MIWDKYCRIIRRNTVMKVLRAVDSEGVTLRSKKRLKRRLYTNKGPNHIWHVDGYDKLSPYGITIHGCIDGFSRKIIWMKVSPTNHHPKVIARYYLEAVERTSGCPLALRSDYGTENCTLAALHIAMRSSHEPNAARSCYIYGPSKRNIRIEGWWSILRRFETSWWINSLKDLESEGYYNDSQLHRRCVAYAMAHLVEAELNDFVQHWNTHCMRANRLTGTPSATPSDLYDMPSSYRAGNCIQTFNTDIWVYGMLYDPNFIH